MNKHRFAFKMDRLTIPVDHILPIRNIKDPEKKVRRYPAIISTMREVGLIEPLMVYPHRDNLGYYLLMDGHLRLMALQELGRKDADCIIALEDESYTYNAKINRLAPIQERQMILKAVESGVPVERIANALNIDIAEIRSRLSLTDGLSKEVVELLKDKQIAPKTLKLLRRVVPKRQLEMAELMVTANNYTNIYAEALLIGTPKNKLVRSTPQSTKKIKPEDLAKMEMEMESLQEVYKACEQTFSQKMLQLTVFRRYVIRLLENTKVNRFLRSKHPEIHEELSEIIANETVC